MFGMEESSVSMDRYCDFLFIEEDGKRTGVIVDEESFESIFDMQKQYQEEAQATFSEAPISDMFIDKEKAVELIKEDRIIQKMIRNPVAAKGFKEVEIGDIVHVKESLKEIVSLDFEIKNGKIELPKENEKKALRDLIKTIAHRFSQTLFKEHYIEGTPERLLK
jgi:hypothetical protein